MPAWTTMTTHEARRLPLSPPDYHAAYALTRASGSRLAAQLPYLPAPTMVVGHDHETVNPYADWYARGHTVGVSIQAKPPALPAMPRYLAPHGYYGTGYGPRPMDYGPVGAPVLPSLRAHPRLLDHDAPPSYHASTYGPVGQPPVKEEEPQAQAQPQPQRTTGGVSAVLDYDPETMADFAADMAQSIVHPNVPVSPAFRKFIVQLLGATRLPSATVLLALYYVVNRMTTLSSHDLSQHEPAEVYRMLTVALMIASKFLDDNTFQNRSWADVTGIAVGELNVMERSWLFGVGWKMHVRPEEHVGYRHIVETWRRWGSNAAAAERVAVAAAVSSSRMQLPAIDTSVTRYHGGVYADASSSLLSSVRSSYDMTYHGNMVGYPTVSGRDGFYSRNGSYASASSGYVGSNYGSFANGGGGSISGGSGGSSSHNHHHHHNNNNGYHDHGWGYGRGPIESSPPSAPETGPTTPDYLNYPGAWSYHFSQPTPYSCHRPHPTPSNPFQRRECDGRVSLSFS